MLVCPKLSALKSEQHALYGEEHNVTKCSLMKSEHFVK